MLAVAALGSVGVGSPAAPSAASADALTWKGCISAEARSANRPSCATLAGSAASRAFEPLDALALSPDGRSLYSGAGIDCRGNGDVRCTASAAVGRFRRDPNTGSLDYRDCLTGLEPSAGCTEISGATPNALGAALGDIASVAVSPDGRSLYAASSGIDCDIDDSGSSCFGSNALARFDRDPATGAIAYRDCITGDRRSGPSGSGVCTEIPSATEDGYGSGLSGSPLYRRSQSIALSADGESLYVGASGDDAIARFDRDPDSGALAYRGCITGNEQLGPSGSGACAEIPSATADGRDSGLYGVQSIVLSDDGKSLYGAAPETGIVRFDRDRDTGEIRYQGCITGSEQFGPSGSGICAEVPTATMNGSGSGLKGVWSVALSPDGTSLYASSFNDDAIAHFDRDPKTRAITFAGCITGRKVAGPDGTGACRRVRSVTGDGFGFPAPSLIVVGAKGGSLYATHDISVAHFRTNPRTGAIRYDGCIIGAWRITSSCVRATPPGVFSGLRHITALAATARSLYVGSTGIGDYNDIVRFDLAPQTRIGNAKTRGRRAVFKFRASAPSKFRCKLKGRHVPGKLRGWRRCGSGRFRHKGREVYRHLRPGRKVFRVRATDRAHTTDPTPAKRHWRVR